MAPNRSQDAFLFSGRRTRPDLRKAGNLFSAATRSHPTETQRRSLSSPTGARFVGSRRYVSSRRDFKRRSPQLHECQPVAGPRTHRRRAPPPLYARPRTGDVSKSATLLHKRRDVGRRLQRQ
ncbi:hypothetical protein GN956_G22143 [Arapaima gigas]